MNGDFIGECIEAWSLNDMRAYTVQEYLTCVDKIFGWLKVEAGDCGNAAKDVLWYRGQTSEVYDLQPSIYRDEFNSCDENIYLSKFKAKAIPYIDRHSGNYSDEMKNSYWSWLFLMNRCGLPTRIMNWSGNALTGLLFAVADRNEKDRQYDAVVWVLNPVRLNEPLKLYHFLPEGHIPSVEEKTVYRLFGPDSKPPQGNHSPVAVTGPFNSAGAYGHAEAFTLHPNTKKPASMERLPSRDRYLYRILIASEYTDGIKEQLRNYGITCTSLFPDILKIADEIRDELGLKK